MSETFLCDCFLLLCLPCMTLHIVASKCAAACCCPSQLAYTPPDEHNVDLQRFILLQILLCDARSVSYIKALSPCLPSGYGIPCCCIPTDICCCCHCCLHTAARNALSVQAPTTPITQQAEHSTTPSAHLLNSMIMSLRRFSPALLGLLVSSTLLLVLLSWSGPQDTAAAAAAEGSAAAAATMQSPLRKLMQFGSTFRPTYR